MRITPVFLKIIHFVIFLRDQTLSLLASFFKIKIHLKKSLWHVYVYAMALT